MTWVRLDDGFAEHPKMEVAGPLGLALHVAALCYCARHLTDGHIPASKVPRLLDLPSWRKVVDGLIDAGAWDKVNGGYQLHDYLDYQPSRASVMAEREDKTQAGIKGNHKRWHVDRNEPDATCPLCIAEGIAPAIADGIAPATSVGFPPTRPDPTPTTTPPVTYAKAATEGVELWVERELQAEMQRGTVRNPDGLRAALAARADRDRANRLATEYPALSASQIAGVLSGNVSILASYRKGAAS